MGKTRGFGKLLLVLALTFSLIAALVSIGCSIETVRAEGTPRSVTEGNVRVTVLDSDVIRLELKANDGFTDAETLQMAGKSEYKGADFTVVTEGNFCVINTGKYKVYVRKNATDLKGSYIKDSKTRKHMWSYSGKESNSGELPTPSNTPEAFAINDCPRVTPPEGGYFSGITDDPLSGYKIENEAKDIYVILAGGDGKKLRSEYVKLTGRTNMLPLSALGLWESRYYEYTAESAQAVVQQYYDHDFYIDNFVLDTDWRRSSGDLYGIGYDVNTDLFPDIAAFFKQMHDQNINVIANDHVKMADGAANAFSPKDIAYRSAGLTSLLEKGLDAWWYDRNWTRGGLVSPTRGINRETIGMYVYQSVTEHYYEQLAKANGDEYARRAFIMANVDNIRHGSYKGIQNVMSHRYSLQWTGDISTNGDSLNQEVANMIKAGMNGIAYESSDLGGHVGKPGSGLYLRWTQYGALSPIYRTHSNRDVSIARTPWAYGDYETKVTRNYLSMRYHLLPVYYALSHENYMTGMPMMRSLEFDYPQYEQSRRTDQYLLGENILVAPMTNKVVAASANEFHALKMSLFGNRNLEGEPVVTTDIDKIDFDWGKGSPAEGVGADNFSAIITGKFIPKTTGKYSILSDDGCRVYINGNKVLDHWKASNSEVVGIDYDFVAGKIYDLKVEYYEGTGGAKLSMCREEGNKRDVFIPDGEWIDVWTGNAYAGPKVIEVRHDSSTSPVFVRAGSAITLAEDMKNTREKDWSNLALDWYPANEGETSGVLYEDDTTTLAYKDGKYRETAYRASYSDGGKIARLVIDAAKGGFTGDRAFNSRNWKVRVHVPYGWSAPASVKVNGQTINATYCVREKSAVPFSYNGSTPDGDVYEITFSSEISKANTVEVTFDSCEREVRGAEPEFDTFTLDHADQTASSVDMSVNTVPYYAVAKISGGNISTVAYGKKTGEIAFSGEVLTAADKVNFKLKNASDYASYGAATTDGKFTVTVTTVGKGAFNVLVGGNKASAMLTVKDNYGNMQSINTGSVTGEFLRKFTVNCTHDGEVTYTIAYEGKGENVAFYAVYGDKEAEPFTLTAIETDRTYGLDLTSPLFSDYAYYAHKDGKMNTGEFTEYKKPGVKNSGIGALVYNDGGGNHDDKHILPVLDSIPVKADGLTSLTRSTIFTRWGTFTQKVKVSGKGVINVYIGGWRSKVNLTVTDPDNNSRTLETGNTDTNFYRTIKIGYDVEKETEYTITFTNSANYRNAVYSGVSIQPETDNDYTLEVEMNALDSLTDLSAAGNLDWYYFNKGSKPGSKPARKNLPENERYIGEFALNGKSGPFWDYKSILYFCDGIREGEEGIVDITSWGLALTSGTESFSVKVDGKTDYVRLYLSSWHSGGVLTVKDGEKTVYQNVVIYCADNAKSGYGRYVDVKFDTDGKEKTFSFTLSNAFEKSNTNVAIVAIAVGSYEKESAAACVSRSLESYEGGDAVDVENALDYFTFTDSVTKKNGDFFKTISGSDVIDTDLKNYKDITLGGEKVSGLATAKNGVHVGVAVKKDQKVKVTMYLGALNSTAVILVSDKNGNVLVRETLPGGTDGAYAKFSFVAGSRVDQTLRVDVITTQRSGNGTVFVVAGNVVLSAENVHDYIEIGRTEGTCLTEGEVTYECGNCHETYTEKTGFGKHDYVDTVVASTCTTKGYTKHVCSVCGNSYTDNETELADHEYDAEVHPATCRSKGYTEYYCVNCGKIEKRNETMRIRHIEGDWITDKEATCTEKGSRHTECTMCGKKFKTAEISANGHSFGEWTTEKPSTCTEKGSEKRICTTCGKEERRDLDLIAHDYEDTVIAPTCTKEGYTKHTCKVCGDTYEDSVTEKIEHKWNDGEITRQPTTEEEGEKTFTCSECGTTRVESIAKLENKSGSSGCGSCKAKTESDALTAGMLALMTLLSAAVVIKRKK
ncbi:MAG: glycoside hydrolase family 31 protein [Firmicutes bacterium]|nr:glycoside hydrolase family 31 protein [Bacillota bacterium]MDY5530701.1 glycoside hydrolase family 31 protein [Pumilibacteraceae bacterium]